MRRLCSLICCVLSLLLCASCLAEEPAFRVSVANLCEAELYGIHYEYALGGEPAGGGIICNASGGPIAEGIPSPEVSPPEISQKVRTSPPSPSSSLPCSRTTRNFRLANRRPSAPSMGRPMNFPSRGKSGRVLKFPES